MDTHPFSEFRKSFHQDISVFRMNKFQERLPNEVFRLVSGHIADNGTDIG